MFDFMSTALALAILQSTGLFIALIVVADWIGRVRAELHNSPGEETLADIADEVREKVQTEGTFTADDVAYYLGTPWTVYPEWVSTLLYRGIYFFVGVWGVTLCVWLLSL